MLINVDREGRASNSTWIVPLSPKIYTPRREGRDTHSSSDGHLEFSKKAGTDGVTSELRGIW